ncbi:hypothetical protein CMT52_07905 [Elizabethkingia anophelis]|nr:hypothetical protein [Elizabethkingia anophelis]
MSEFGQRINEIEKNLQYVYCKVKNMGSNAVQSVSSASTFLSVNNTDPKNPTLNLSDGGFWKVGGNPNVTYSPDGRILSYIGGLNETTLGVVDYTKLTERLKDNERLKAIDSKLNDLQARQQQLYDDFSSGKITQAEFEQKQNELSQEAGVLYEQRTTVFNEEASKLKDVEGIQVLKVDSNKATFFKSVYTTNSVQSAYYSDKISIWETRLGFYENESYRYGYDGSEFIQHLKDINTTVRISSYQTMGNAPYSKDVVARYPNGTIAFLSSALDSSLKKFVSAPYSSGTPYFVTDKIPVFTNLQNADGDSTFNKQLVANGYGVVGIKSVDADTGTTKKSIVTQPVDAGLEGNDTNPYQVRIMTRVESDIRFISGTSGNGSISASNASYSTDKYVNIHENSVYMSVFTHEGINPNTGLQRYRVDIMIPVSKALVLSNKDTANDTIIKIQCENSAYKYELNGKIPAAIINRIITENLT